MGKVMRNLVLRLGDVAIPVGLIATSSDPDEKLFRTLHRECKTPITLRVYCPSDERVLEAEETVKAWEVAPGQFLELAVDELDALTPPDSSVIPLAGFVRVHELDALLVKKRYHLAPTKASVGRRAYRALAAAIDANGVAAIARFHTWNSEQLAAITAPGGDVLELATLHFAEDVALEQRDEISEQLAELPVGGNVANLMRDVVDRYTRALQPDDLASLDRPRVRELLERKLAGESLVEPDHDERPPETPVAPADLETALKATLKAAPRKRRARAAASR